MEQAERGHFREYQPPGRRSDARKGTARRPPSAPALFAGNSQRSESHRDAGGTAGVGHHGAEYDAWLIKIGDGDQFGSGFVAINPNSKIPALVDRSGSEADPGLRVGRDPGATSRRSSAPSCRPSRRRAECLSWLFWQMGSAPYVGGGFGHFYASAVKIEYAIDRFAMETKRQLDVLNRRLADNEYICGGDYTIADIAMCPWYGGLVKGGLMAQRRSSSACTNTRMFSVGRTRCSNGRPYSAGGWSTVLAGELSSQLHERHDASDFQTKTQDKMAEQK